MNPKSWTNQLEGVYYVKINKRRKNRNIQKRKRGVTITRLSKEYKINRENIKKKNYVIKIHNKTI